jgi:hypothetical protein
MRSAEAPGRARKQAVMAEIDSGRVKTCSRWGIMFYGAAVSESSLGLQKKAVLRVLHAPAF